MSVAAAGALVAAVVVRFVFLVEVRRFCAAAVKDKTDSKHKTTAAFNKIVFVFIILSLLRGKYYD